MRDYRRLYGAAMTKLAAEATKEEKQAPAASSFNTKLNQAWGKTKQLGQQAWDKTKKYSDTAYTATKDFLSDPDNIRRIAVTGGSGVLGALLGGPKHRLLGALLGSAAGFTADDLLADKSYLREGYSRLNKELSAQLKKGKKSVAEILRAGAAKLEG